MITAVGGPPDGPITRSPDYPIARSPNGPMGRWADEPVGRWAILPGLVNAHTHLELSWMRGRVPPARSMPEWAERLIALRRSAEVEARGSIAQAIREARASGTSAVGDITNTWASYQPLAQSELSAVLFCELIGFNAPDPSALVRQAQRQLDGLMPVDRLRASIAPHAPYSVSPALLREIAQTSAGPTTIHLGESKEEVEFLRSGSGAWRAILAKLGAWTDDWDAPRGSPVDFIAAQGLVNDRLLAVHCTQLDDGDLRKLASAGATVVACPRSNRWTGAGLPPIERFYASGVRVAVGTDSLASVEDLNVFGELAMMRRLAPFVAARTLLESATRHGADALGFSRELGTIERGKRAELIAVTLPDVVDDVEEYLVSGIQPRDVRWLEA